jgi:CRISPR-associated DxTHG motif protein
VFTLLWVIFRKPIWESLAWGLHILLDIFTHSFRFFPTPFLWPISDFKVNGWHWGRPEIVIPNIFLLVLLYAWFLYRRWRGRKGPTEAFSQR